MKSLYLVAIAFFTLTVQASGPAVWSVNTRAEVLRGDARGVSIDQDGTITLAPKVSEIYKTGQPYVWSSVVDPVGNIYLGTGGEGRIFKVDASGKGTLLTKLPEMNVSALAVGPGGTLFAATSPDGKVYQIDASGRQTVYFSPNEKYIWSLVTLGDGSLAVGTGDGGRIYKVRTANASPAEAKIFDSSESHVISMAADRNGNLIAGTDPGGIVMRFGSDGHPFALLDSSLREVHKICVAPDGSIYVLVLGESASAGKSESSSPTATPEAKPAATSTPEPSRSRYDLSGAKSAVYRIGPDGTADLIWTSGSVTAFSMAMNAQGDGVVLGTSDKGRLYEIGGDGREMLLLQTDADQISNLIAASGGYWAASSNQGTLYRIGPERVSEGSYESSILDARSAATWGRLWWGGGPGVTLQTRSGNTERPNETWSEWSTPITDAKGGQVASPRARFIQWRADIKGSGQGVSLYDVNLAYAPRNIAPEVLSIQVLPTNVGLVANPPTQIDPNIRLSGMEPSAFGVAVGIAPPRRIYQRGATSLVWTAEDRNGDSLVYDVQYKEVGESTFRPLRTEMTENYLSIDGQSLADGRYLFKIVARDTPSNPAQTALSGEKVVGPISIDNTPPTVSIVGSPSIAAERLRMVFDASDAASYITRAEYSLNGGAWLPVYPDDGIADSPRERFTVDAPAVSGENVVTIKVFDVNGNTGNARASVRR